MLTIHYKLTNKEYGYYNYYLRWKSPDQRSHRLKYFASNLPIYAVLIFASVYAWYNGRIGFEPILITLAWLSVAILVILWRMKATHQKEADAWLAESGEDNLLPAMTLIINEEGIVVKTQYGQNVHPWSSFHKKRMVNNSYYLYISPNQALIIPNRCLSKNQKEELDYLVMKYFPISPELDRILESK